MVHVSVQHLTTVVIILLDATRQHSDGLVLDAHHPSIRIVAKAETQERWPKLANKGLVRYADDQMASHELSHEQRFSRSLDENEPEQSGSLPHKHEKDQSTGTSEDVSHSEHDNKTKDISPTSPGIATRATSGLYNLLGYLKPQSWSKQPTMPTVEKETSLHVRESDKNKQSQLENEHEAAKSGAIDHKSADKHSSREGIESDSHSGHEAAKSDVIKRKAAKDQFSSGIKTVNHHGNEAAKSGAIDHKSADKHSSREGIESDNHSGHEAAKSGVIKRKSAKDQFSSGIKTVSHHGNEAAKSGAIDHKSADKHSSREAIESDNHSGHEAAKSGVIKRKSAKDQFSSGIKTVSHHGNEAAKSGAIDHKSADKHSSREGIESDSHSGHEAAKSDVIKRKAAKDQFSSGIKTVSHRGHSESSAIDPKSAEDHSLKGTGSHNTNHHHSSQHASTKVKKSLADRVRGVWSSKFPAVKKNYTRVKGGLSKVFTNLRGILKQHKKKLSDWIRSWKAQKGSKDTEDNVPPNPDTSRASSGNSKAKAPSIPNSPRKSESTARSLIGKDHKYNAISS
ncbi:unnamed protein product [Albugo candida]|uniref:Uncharacterized protein n=1 Tax=Albugo candida TaxID=65357 RepID=A0A024GPY6_9STRA|nr:unnamed protein product [Albugo candida]|eukprot:CCI48923.1 unnamed protein product [Albugo candida]